MYTYNPIPAPYTHSQPPHLHAYSLSTPLHTHIQITHTYRTHSDSHIQLCNTLIFSHTHIHTAHICLYIHIHTHTLSHYTTHNSISHSPHIHIQYTPTRPYMLIYTVIHAHTSLRTHTLTSSITSEATEESFSASRKGWGCNSPQSLGYRVRGC